MRNAKQNFYVGVEVWARGSVVGRGTVLQAGRSSVRI
jgi:hypothetical protein